MAFQATVGLSLTIKKDLESKVDGITSPSLTYDKRNIATTLKTDTSPAASKGTKQLIALSSGAKTIDLTALDDAGGGTITLTSLKARIVQIENPSTNANNMTFAAGASNGYNIFGASGQVTLAPGQMVQLYFADGAGTIGSGAKTIDVTGTGSQSFYFGIVAG